MPRSEADGGGRAWLERDGKLARVVAGSTERWTIVYEAGPLGVAEGGAVYLQVPPFWGWSSPQVRAPKAPGYTTVSTDAGGVELEAAAVDNGLLQVTIRGRTLAAHERVRLVYGAGPAGARADRYAEHRSPLWIAVDGDGDGVRRTIADSPTIDVEPGPAARLLLTLPSSARVGETVLVRLAALDALGNDGCRVDGRIVLEQPPSGLEV
ncbi:MAG: hypothetical protein JSV80_01905, partial [Acidobacteriota bacterium]